MQQTEESLGHEWASLGVVELWMGDEVVRSLRAACRGRRGRSDNTGFKWSREQPDELRCCGWVNIFWPFSSMEVATYMLFAF